MTRWRQKIILAFIKFFNKPKQIFLIIFSVKKLTYYFQNFPVDGRANKKITGSKLQLQITREIRTGNLLHKCLMFYYENLDTGHRMLLLKLHFQIENKRTHLIKILQDFFTF